VGKLADIYLEAHGKNVFSGLKMPGTVILSVCAAIGAICTLGVIIYGCKSDRSLKEAKKSLLFGTVAPVLGACYVASQCCGP
jgi:hypothetical protein